MEGLVKGQIKPVPTATSIRPCRQRLLSKQYLSLWGEKRPLVLHLKVQSHCFGVMGVAAGVWLSFQPCYCCVYRISLFFLHFPLWVLFRCLLYYITLTMRYDFPDKTIPHSACLCTSVPILTFLRQAVKGRYFVCTMKYDCVCLLLIMANIGSCNGDNLAVAL